jgi:hypothetical protein
VRCFYLSYFLPAAQSPAALHVHLAQAVTIE